MRKGKFLLLIMICYRSCMLRHITGGFYLHVFLCAHAYGNREKILKFGGLITDNLTLATCAIYHAQPCIFL